MKSRRYRSEDGQIIVLSALMIIALFAVIGIAVDVGRIYVTRAELSRAVDAAALAGVLELPSITDATTKVNAYMAENEPTATVTTPSVPGDNQLKVTASKPVSFYFLQMIGIDNYTVSAKATAGFGIQPIDAVMVIDATSSMGDSPCNGSQNNSGCPIWEAKNAAKSFKDILLGASPDGNVAVGVAAFRGCYGRDTTTATARMNISTFSNCIRHDTGSTTQVSTLLTSPSTLDTKINAISAVGGSGTNVCGGVLKGWEVLDGTGNHLTESNLRRFLVLLSDGDNRYTGSYTYQGSPASPHTYSGNSCKPSSCSSVSGGSGSCTDAVHTNVVQVVTVTDSFEQSAFPNSGSGWDAQWTLGGGDTPTRINTSTPQSGSWHVRIRSTGVMTREFDLSLAASATLNYYWKSSSLESGDNLIVQMSGSSSGPWTGQLVNHTTNQSSYTSTGSSNLDISAFAGDSSVFLRFQGSMDSTSDNFYIDNIRITGSTTQETPADGYWNGDDGSNNCSTVVRRERELDKLTWAAAKAAEAQDVEIFVVAFGICSSNATTYTQAQCDANIGNTDSDSTSDQRLLKCVASSNISTNDHYFYASSAGSLPTIFTTIAQQIAHRLIE